MEDNDIGLKEITHETDDYGCEQGAQALDRILTARHVAHEFHLFPGRHDVTYFAEHLPASLVFTSKYFGGQ